MATVTDLIGYAIHKDAVGFKTAFGEIMQDITSEKIEAIKQKESFNFFKVKAPEGEGNEEV